MSKVFLVWYHRYTPEIMTTGIICFVWALFFHWARGISWAGSFVLALLVFMVGAALGTLLVNLLDRTRY
ncbi:hypothetical protein [Pantoea sp. BAV 3049]|uniref:hypothetical protein n=1 Tax=Pantoea sp. BAV 3049 TaxID=2654188 RepID=UPI00131C3BB6|nr:hypothetical protein [Pantoea sp. BAV 3049]